MHLLTLGSFVLFTALVGALTWWLTRHDRHDTSDGYFLAGRTLTGGYIAGSLLLTNLSTEQLVGLNGLAYQQGLSVFAWEVVAAVSLVVMGLVFLPRYLRSGVATVPQFLEERFDRHTRTITSVIFIVAYTAVVLPMILYTGATGLNGILDTQALTGVEDPKVRLWLMVWLVGIIGSIYAIFGGLRTVAVSDTLNGFLLLVGGVLITWFGLQAIRPDDPLGALRTLQAAHPEKFNSLGGPDAAVPFSTLFSGVLLINMFYWCTNQQIIQRAFAASNLAEGQRGVMLAGIAKALAPLILVLPGIIAFHLYAADDIKPDHAYGTLVRHVLPAPLVGFFAAALVGAILSSFNSVLNSSATLFSLGIYRGIFHPRATDQQAINAGKAFGGIIAVGSMLAAPYLAGQESIFAYLQKMNGLYFIPIFAVVIVGMFSRRTPAIAANCALIAGCTVIALGYFVPSMAKHVARVGDFHFLGLVFVALIGLMLAIGAMRPRATPWQQRDSLAVDLTPWRWAWPMGLALIACVLAIYVYFADPSVLGWGAENPAVTGRGR